MNPLTTVKWPLIMGFVVAVAIAALVDGGLAFNAATLASLTRWLHVIFGVFWIGLLYYFNAVQTPAMAVAAADKDGPGGAGINKYVAPRALLWFRWSALATWLAGAYLLSQTHGRFINTFTFGLLEDPVARSNVVMGFGAWFGTIMLLNVWGLIWPNQKKILGLVPATDDEKNKARRVAFLGAQSRPVCLAREFPALHPHADVHDRALARVAVLVGDGAWRNFRFRPTSRSRWRAPWPRTSAPAI